MLVVGKCVLRLRRFGEDADGSAADNRQRAVLTYKERLPGVSSIKQQLEDETEVSDAMKNPKIQIKIGLGLGKGRDRVLTCDLTKEYVAINGDYRS